MASDRYEVKIQISFVADQKEVEKALDRFHGFMKLTPDRELKSEFTVKNEDVPF